MNFNGHMPLFPVVTTINLFNTSSFSSPTYLPEIPDPDINKLKVESELS